MYLARAALAAGGTALVVVKIMSKVALVHMKQVENVQREKAVLEQWDCLHIVRSLGAMADTSRLYLLLEFIDAGDLFQVCVELRARSASR